MAIKSRRFEMRIPETVFSDLKRYADTRGISVAEATKDAIKLMLNKKAGGHNPPA